MNIAILRNHHKREVTYSKSSLRNQNIINFSSASFQTETFGRAITTRYDMHIITKVSTFNRLWCNFNNSFMKYEATTFTHLLYLIFVYEIIIWWRNKIQLNKKSKMNSKWLVNTIYRISFDCVLFNNLTF